VEGPGDRRRRRAAVDLGAGLGRRHRGQVGGIELGDLRARAGIHVRLADDLGRARGLATRPVEVEGTVVTGDARGGTLGFPTANLNVRPELLVPANGIYAGSTGEHRAAVSIGTNPHYGGCERRVEAHLLDFDGDLYGQRLVVQLWERLRDEAAFDTEDDLIAQIASDVEATRRAKTPA